MNKNKAYERSLYVIMGIIIALYLTGCSKTYVPIKYNVKKPPTIMVVNVKGGTINGNDLKNVVTNHINAWDYISYLRIKLGVKL